MLLSPICALQLLLFLTLQSRIEVEGQVLGFRTPDEVFNNRFVAPIA
jgi:hypothetical protein